MKWDWEHAWAGFAMAVATLVVIFLCFFVMADKKVRGYYLGNQQSAGTCVMQSIDWDNDDPVFCSPDIDKLLDVLTKANASLARGSK